MQRIDILKIFSIHGNDQVKRLQISQRNPATAALKIIATIGRNLPHSRVSRVALMIANGARRIDDDSGIVFVLPNEGLEDAFASRRSTDIAQADEENRFEVLAQAEPSKKDRHRISNNTLHLISDRRSGKRILWQVLSKFII